MFFAHENDNLLIRVISPATSSFMHILVAMSIGLGMLYTLLISCRDLINWYYLVYTVPQVWLMTTNQSTNLSLLHSFSARMHRPLSLLLIHHAIFIPQSTFFLNCCTTSFERSTTWIWGLNPHSALSWIFCNKLSSKLLTLWEISDTHIHINSTTIPELSYMMLSGSAQSTHITFLD